MQREFLPTVYILASHRNGTLYIGVTSNLMQRLHQHRTGITEGFTNAYGVHRLVWFETGASMEEAIRREKQIKKWNRQWKIDRSVSRIPTGATLRLTWGSKWCRERGVSLMMKFDFVIPAKAGIHLLPVRFDARSGNGFPLSRE